MNEQDKKLKEAREKCLTNAEALLSVAERELGKGVDHICFHLALLALEEIGKAILLTVAVTVAVAGKEKRGLSIAMDDHEKKIFWAVWGGFMRGDKFTQQDIEKNKEFATGLHASRLAYLYTDPNNPAAPEEKMRDDEAKKLVELVRARLELEKLSEFRELEDDDVSNLAWFFTSAEDPEKAKYIFGGVSLAKFAELKDAKEWMKWLREGFQKHEDDMRALTQNEWSRQKPSDDEAFKPKFKMRVRIQSPSHTIKDNAFQKWNEGVHDVKFYKVGKKQLSQPTKSEVLIDFTFPKALHVTALWEHGFYTVKTLVIAINIATRGIFWWNVPKDLEKFYEEITDVEADPKGGTKVMLVLGKRLNVNWDEVHLSLDQEEVVKIMTAYAFLMNESEKLKQFLITYATALTFLSKIDIHLRMEANAFDEFWKALKLALIAFGDWDEKSDLKEAIKKQFEKIGEMKDLEKMIDLAVALEGAKGTEKIPLITLTEVIAMKLYCDYYLHLKINEYIKARMESNPPENTEIKE